MGAMESFSEGCDQISKWLCICPELGITYMDHLFNRLSGAMPGLWKKNFSNENDLRDWAETWADAFELEKLTFSEVKRGIQRVSVDPPLYGKLTCGAFIKLCRSMDIVPLDAYYEAVQGMAKRDRGEDHHWSHPCIYWAAAAMGYDIRHKTWGEIERNWTATLTAEFAKGEWEEIKSVGKNDYAKLPYDPYAKTEKNRASQAQTVADVKTDQVVKQAKDGGFDHKGWAKKIICDLAAGSHSYPVYAVQSAREVLGLAK